MKVLQIVVVALLMVSAFATELEGKPRRGRRSRVSSNFSIKPLTWGGAKVVVVPKCDHRAYGSHDLHLLKCRGRTPPISVKAAPLDPRTTPGLAPVVVPRRPTPAAVVARRVTPAAAAVRQVLRPRPMLKSAAPAGQQSAACTSRKGVCGTAASCKGSIVRGVCPGPSDWTCCVAKSTAPSAPSTPPPATTPGSGTDSCLRNFNGATFAAKAIQYQQHYLARGVKYSQSQRQFGYDVNYADCTSFGFTVMQAVGYGCLFDKARYTAGMKPLMQARGGFHQVPKTGDIAMWGGHFGIVVQACAGGKVDMVAMGNSGCRRTNCITVQSLKGWGSGGWIGFWTPRAN